MNLANNVSVVRVLLVPVFVTCLIYETPSRSYLHHVSVAVFLIACLSDALDGYLARMMNQKTVFGSYIDPIADKLLLVSGFLSLTLMSHLPDAMRIPAWVTIPVVTRDIVILAGSTMIFFTTGALRAEPIFISKATTFFQMLTLITALVAAPEIVRLTLYGTTVVLTLCSGILYIRMGGRLIQS